MVSSDVKRDFARMIAARQRLVDLRTSRNQQLVRLRAALTVLLSDFVATLDPVSNSRLAEVSIEGNKVQGESAVTVAFFEGTRFRLAVDAHARFSHVCSVPGPFDDCAQIYEIRTSEDGRRAELTYQPSGDPDARAVIDLVAFVCDLAARATANVEAELQHIASLPAAAPAPLAPEPAAPRPARTPPAPAAASTPKPRAETPALRLTLAEAPAGSDVLTLRVG